MKKLNKNFVKKSTRILLGVLLLTGFFASGQVKNNIQTSKPAPYPIKNRPHYKSTSSAVPCTGTVATATVNGITITASGSQKVLYTPPISSETCLPNAAYTGCGYATLAQGNFGSGAVGFVTYTFSQPVTSAVIGYAIFDNYNLTGSQGDFGYITTNSCGTTTLFDTCGVWVSGNMIQGSLGGALHGAGDVRIKVTSNEPFTQITFTDDPDSSSIVEQGKLSNFVLTPFVCNLPAPLFLEYATNINCPATTFNLNNFLAPTNLPASAPPCNSIGLTWHTATPATLANKVVNPAVVPAGTYYAAFNNSLSGCYSPTTAINITATPLRVPTFTQVAPICAGTAFVLPSSSTNTLPIRGTWSPAINNLATTIYTFTPTAGQCASTTTMTVVVNQVTITPTFTQYPTYCAGTAFVLPSSSTNTPPITGTWSPTINNLATTTYTFRPTAGQCASTTTMTVVINPINITINTQPINYQKICLNTPAQNLIVGATGNIVSYQWYQNNIPTSSFGATLIPWGTGSTFTPPTNAVGTIFYYVVIKNSSNCTLRSDIVQVTVANGTSNAGVLSGMQNVCIGSTTQFASTVSGGTWTSSNPAVATVNATTGLVTGIRGGSATITYTKVGALCNSSVIRTVVVVTNNTLIANNDTITTYQSATLQTTTANCISNDTLNGVLNPTGVTATQTNALITGITLNTNGTISILPSVAAGTYTLQYKITNTCGQSNIGRITLTVSQSVVTYTGGDCFFQNPCFENYPQNSADTLFTVAGFWNTGGIKLNGLTANQNTVSITPITPLPTGISLNTDGTLKGISKNYFFF